MLLSTSSVTGPAELCLEDARGLADAGHEVLFGLDTRRPGNYADAVRAAGFPVLSELALCRKSSPLESLRDVVRLRRRMREADLVHARFSHDHTLALAALQGLGPRRPALVRTAETLRSTRPGALRGVAFRACDAVVVPCADYSLRLQRHHRVPAPRLHVVPGRVDTVRFCPGTGRLRASLGLPSHAVLFGIVSRIKPDRLHEVLLRALARVASLAPDAHLAIVGRGEHEPYVRALAAQLGLAGRVHFPGYRTGPDLVDAYRSLDAKVWLAEGNDGTCRAVLEALACGVPVLAGDAGAMPELVRHGVDGLVVAPKEEAVGAALVELADRTRRRTLAGAARARALEFTGERRTRALLEVYRLALQERDFAARMP